MNWKNADIVVVGPADIDYPLFRKFLHDVHYSFNKIYYVISTPVEHNTRLLRNLKSFIEQDLWFAEILQVPDIDGKDDWRDISTNLALNKSTSEYVLFIEPDFLITPPTLYSIPTHDIIGYYETGATERIWPSFLCVKRSIIDKTSKIFYPTINYDHFDLFTEECLKCTNDVFYLNEHNIEFTHYSGVTQNLTLCGLEEYQSVPLGTSDKSFITYLENSLNANVKIEKNWSKVLQTAIFYYKTKLL